MNEILINIFGWVGAILLVLAYGLVSIKRVGGDSIFYQILNVIASVLLITNSYYYKAFPSVAVNCIWISIALITIFRNVRKNCDNKP
jgi:hypothetical protein